jgi:hypothetical protein
MYETEDQAKHAIDQLTRVGLQVSFAKVGYVSVTAMIVVSLYLFMVIRI